MKLAIVTAFPPSKVTLNEYGYHLAKHFAQNSEIEELILITDYTQEKKQIDFEAPNCKITVKDSWSFNSYKNIFSIYKSLKTSKPDAILFNLQFMKFGDKKIPAALGLFLPLIFRIKKIPTIVLLHNILETVDLGNAGFTENKILQRVFNTIGSILTRVILQADTVALTIGKYVEVVKQKYKAQNVIQIPHGSFETPPEPNFDLPAGPKKIMTFGKFGTYKKVEILIEAVEKLRKKTNQELEIVIAGTDSPNTPGYLDTVKQKYKHVKNLTFTGYVAEEDVPIIFGESAVVVFPYTSTTGSSGVLHQAGSYGKAVVMPNLGDLALLVEEEGYTGEFFIPGNVDSLANSLECIVEDEAYRKRIGATNYKAACSLPMEKITQMYLNEFKKIEGKKLGFKYANIG
ncbi:glycosyltransferase [Salegentibacter sp. BLCTC]|uniref:glycosyltransferase n=1 Tax=Salegentibacter sp. BLCTC TaxID=2697368 RepID=UPI00187B3EA8|nr:glycosyltransferase [Salegentibacter sp. BLCTC]MBE7640593.1 glycosyltransferase [Salegentibacter sp. BLCTC]